MNKTYISIVQYEFRDEAKKCGAKYDYEEKKWYINSNQTINDFIIAYNNELKLRRKKIAKKIIK